MFWHPRPPGTDGLPGGHGELVLVLPAFLCSDGSTAALRGFLNRLGYDAHGWGLGVNAGPTPRVLTGVRRRLDCLVSGSGRRAIVIGVSLGGLFARDLAHDRPDAVRQVITLASPYVLPTASPLEFLIRMFGRFYAPVADPARPRRSLPVPSLAVFTREDGIVAWETCRAEEPRGNVLEVRGAHSTIARNPVVLEAIARQLANPAAVDPARDGNAEPARRTR